jgi:hypothetical protein
MTLVDDWTLHQVDQNTRSSSRVITRLVREQICNRRPGYDWARTVEGLTVMHRVVMHVVETGWPPLIWPAFGWGNHEVIKDLIHAESYWPLDPTCYTPPYQVEQVLPGERKREWVLAVIQDHVDWLRGIGFAVEAPPVREGKEEGQDGEDDHRPEAEGEPSVVPVTSGAGAAGPCDEPEDLVRCDDAGNPGLGEAECEPAGIHETEPILGKPVPEPRAWNLHVIGGGLTKRDRSSVMPEAEVVQEYARCWGVLSPPYAKLLGSGWWRNRFVYAAATRTVFWGDPREAPQLGGAYELPLGKIETLGIWELDSLADYQADSLRGRCWTGEQLHHEARRMLADVTGR